MVCHVILACPMQGNILQGTLVYKRIQHDCSGDVPKPVSEIDIVCKTASLAMPYYCKAQRQRMQ